MTIETATTKLIAAVIKAEFGASPQLQIGLFDPGEPDTSELPAAQARFVQLLLDIINRVSVTGSRLLLAGEALGAVALQLAENDHEIVWLSGAQTAQKEVGRGENDILSTPQSLLTYTTTQKFDCIVVAGTYRYLDQLPILSRCRELLCTGGRLILFGEFLKEDSEIAHSTLANLSSQTQLAERLGFLSEQCTDLSLDAMQSVALFNKLLQKQTRQVRDALALDEDAWDFCVAVFKTMQAELTSGRRCFQLHQWQMSDASTNEQLGEYAQAEYGDIDSFAVSEISNLFEQSFGKSFDPQLWCWKYQLSNGKCVVARIVNGGEIVAHYGGAPRKIHYFGKESMAIQVCDVMVLPERRRQYGKSSLFFKAAATFLEREIGNTVNHLLGFGFPNQSAMNIATRLGLYEKTDDFVEVQFLAPAERAERLRCVPLDIRSAEHLGKLATLWQEMLPDFADGIIGLRGPDYIKYRYFDHPGANAGQYRCLLLEAAGGAGSLALVVLKSHGESQLVMDIICPLTRISEIITELNQLVKQEYKAQDLRFWITRGWLHAIPQEGAIVNELGIEIPCNSWNPGPASTTLYGKWWLTAGDMDFM
mgnify:CR=1 FL=1